MSKLAKVFYNDTLIWTGEAFISNNEDERKFVASSLLGIAHRFASDVNATPHFNPPYECEIMKDNKKIGTFSIKFEPTEV